MVMVRRRVLNRSYFHRKGIKPFEHATDVFSKEGKADNQIPSRKDLHVGPPLNCALHEWEARRQVFALFFRHSINCVGGPVSTLVFVILGYLCT